MKRVCMWGTTLGKVADEAQFLAVLRLFERVAPGSEVTIFARPNPHSPGVEDESGLVVRPTFRIDQVTRAIARSDLLVMVGGCFMESRRQAIVCAGLMSIAKACGVPVIGIGVTAFPYRRLWARHLYASVFNAMEMITVREPSAFEALSDLSLRTKIALLADPRYVLTSPPDHAVVSVLQQYGLSDERPLVGVSLRYLHDDMPDWVKTAHDYTREATKKANEAIAQTLDELATVAQIVLLPMNRSLAEDRAAAVLIRDRMKTPEAFNIELPQLRPSELMALIGRSDLIFASRLAAGMFAVSTATPIVGIAYEQRLIDLMSELDLGEYVTSWLSVDQGKLRDMALRAWTERQSSRRLMRSAGQALVASAWSNADVIARYVG